MKIFTNLFLALILFSFANTQAQEKSIAIGLGIGLNRGVNESKPDERNIGPLFGIYGLWNNGLAEGFTPEIAITYYTNGTSDVGGFSQYSTTHIASELRLRYEFTRRTQWTPYALVGFGALYFNVDDVPSNMDIDAKDNGVTLSIPVALGIKYDLNESLAFDFNLGYSTSLTDDINPVYDDIKDGSWFSRLGIHYSIYKSAKDTDGDGLSDDEEAKIGTNPNNPDSDGDGLLDGEEVNTYKSNPLDPDTDKGGVKDGIEVKNSADPLDADDDIMNIGYNEKLVLNGIEFVTGKSEITPKSEKILNSALKAMQKMQNTEFEIVGHTDDVGDVNKNIQLSKDRAESVKTWLINKGVDAKRLTTRGAGPNEPLVPNTSDANRQKNRRVEFYRVK